MINGTISEVALGHCQTSKMALFAKLVKCLKPLNVFAKNPTSKFEKILNTPMILQVFNVSSYQSL